MGASLEAQTFQGRRAGIVSRLVANTVDFLVTLVLLIAGYLGVTAGLFLVSPSRFHFPRPPTGVLILLGALTMFVYLTLCWVIAGRTYGDHLLGLRVVNSRRGSLNLVVAGARAALCVVFPIGVFYAAFSATNRSIADLVLRTSVIYDWTEAPSMPRNGQVPHQYAPTKGVPAVPPKTTKGRS